MCCAYWIFFRLADERMNGTGGGGAERGKEQVPGERKVGGRGKELVPGNRKVSGRVFGAAPGPPPETSQGGGGRALGVASAQRVSRCAAQHQSHWNGRLRRLRDWPVNAPC